MSKIPTFPAILKRRGGSLIISPPIDVVRMENLKEGCKLKVTLELIEEGDEL